MPRAAVVCRAAVRRLLRALWWPVAVTGHQASCHGKEGSTVRVRQRTSETALRRGFLVCGPARVTTSRTSGSGRRPRRLGARPLRTPCGAGVAAQRPCEVRLPGVHPGTQWVPFRRGATLLDGSADVAGARARRLKRRRSDVVLAGEPLGVVFAAANASCSRFTSSSACVWRSTAPTPSPRRRPFGRAGAGAVAADCRPTA